jgi:hypothetical protein
LQVLQVLRALHTLLMLHLLQVLKIANGAACAVDAVGDRGASIAASAMVLDVDWNLEICCIFMNQAHLEASSLRRRVIAALNAQFLAYYGKG